MKKTSLNSYTEKLLISFILAIFYLLTSITIYFITESSYKNTVGVYLIFIALIVLFAEIADIYHSKMIGLYSYVVSFIIACFLLAFRNLSGIDDNTYLSIFEGIIDFDPVGFFSAIPLEPGYIMLNYIVSFFTMDYFYMQIISSMIPLVLFYIAFYKKSYNLGFSVFLLITLFYFQILSHGLVRIFIAVGIITYSIEYLSGKKIGKYFTAVFIAGLFHYSALFMLLFSVLAIIKINAKRCAFFIIISSSILPIVFIFIAQMSSFIGGRYESYVQQASPGINLGDFDTVPILIVFLVFSLIIEKNNLEEKYLIYLTIFCFSSIISVCSNIVPLGRLIFYSNAMMYFLFPYTYILLKNNLSKILFGVIIILYGFSYLYITELSNDFTIPFLFPYKNVFFIM